MTSRESPRRAVLPSLPFPPPPPDMADGVTAIDLGQVRAFLQDVHSIADSQARIADSLDRIADHVAPQPGAIVGTPYVAERLGCTTAWVTQQVKEGRIPKHCILAGTGGGKPWKFHRRQIDDWIKGR